jgi:hypothetical protein
VLLASVRAVREALGFDDMPDVNAALTAALHAAEPMLAALLGTEFDEVERYDLYYVHEPLSGRTAALQTEFRLSRGFVRSEGLRVRRAGTAERTGGSGAFDCTPCVTLRDEIGVVVDLATRYWRDFVRIDYAAGFAPDEDDAASYDLATVPSWLQEAAKLQALITLETHPVLEQAGIKQDTARLDRQLRLSLARHARYTPLAVLPVL